MQPENSPFPCYWWGIGLETVGLEGVRPDVGTYGRYDFKQLPSLPFEMRGKFDWLSRSSPHDSHIGSEKADENSQAILSLRECSDGLGIQLPSVFTTFMETVSLHERIRSNTDCYLDLCPAPVRCPVGDGFLMVAEHGEGADRNTQVGKGNIVRRRRAGSKQCKPHCWQ